jgi:hypothetical protein
MASLLTFWREEKRDRIGRTKMFSSGEPPKLGTSFNENCGNKIKKIFWRQNQLKQSSIFKIFAYLWTLNYLISTISITDSCCYLAKRWRVFLALLVYILYLRYGPFDVSFQKNFNTDCLCIRLGVFLFCSSRFEKMVIDFLMTVKRLQLVEINNLTISYSSASI